MVKKQSVKPMLQSVMGIGCAVFVSDKVEGDFINWCDLKGLLINCNWHESAIQKALIQFNYNSF